MSCLSNKSEPITLNKLDIGGLNMHYRHCGAGEVNCLFLHGMPLSSYMWRHVMPLLSKQASCYAIDLIGMGDSDQPSIHYTHEEHVQFVADFIQAMDLSKIVLVMHGWGSVIGLTLAERYPELVSGIVCLESHIRTITHWEKLSLPVQSLISCLRDGASAQQMVMQDNYLIDKYLPACSMDRLPADVLSEYARPFQTVESRAVLLQYIQELPKGQLDTPVTNAIHTYLQWLKKTDIPKLILYGMPGFITPIDAVSNALQSWSNVSAVELPDAMHLAPESCPDAIASALQEWLEELTLS